MKIDHPQITFLLARGLLNPRYHLDWLTTFQGESQDWAICLTVRKVTPCVHQSVGKINKLLYFSKRLRVPKFVTLRLPPQIWD